MIPAFAFRYPGRGHGLRPAEQMMDKIRIVQMGVEAGPARTEDPKLFWG